LLAAVVALVMSLSGAVAFLAANDWFGAGDLPAMVVWTLPLAGLIYLCFRPVSVRLERSSAVWHYLTLVPLGGLVALGWTVGVALVLGGWILAFSFPVLFCWIAGGLAAGVFAAWLPRLRSWPAAAALAAGVVVGLLQLNAYALTPEPRVRVVLAPGTTHADEERFWREVIGRPGRRPTEHKLLEGISGAGISAYEAGRPVFTVSFDKGLPRERRDSLIAQIRRSRIVARVDTVAESDTSGVRVTPSY
jgi:hypothetical protein